MQGNSKTEGKQSISQGMRKFRNSKSTCENFATPNPLAKIFATPQTPCENFATPYLTCENFRKGCQQFTKPFCLAKSMRNLSCNQHAKFTKQPLNEKPTVNMKAKSLLKILFKGLQSLCLFRTVHYLLWKAQHHLAKQFFLHSTPCDHQFEEDTSASRPISTMTCIRGGHTNPLASREARPRAPSPQDSSQAPQVPIIPSSEGGVPSSPPQRRYLTRRPPTSPPPKPSVHPIPPKRAKTSGPGEMSRHSQPDF